MFDQKRIQSSIESACSGVDLSATTASSIAFHMTDWLSDLSNYVSFCKNPGLYTPDQVNELLLAFLVHVPNHLAAASKLYADFPVTDVFGVGAVQSTASGTEP